MRFRLPQFLDIEDKVFGPFTFKQFAYLIGALAFGYLFWRIIPAKVIAIPLIFIFSGTFLALAFVKVNNRPFADILESAYKFLIGNKTYVWHHEQKIEKGEPKKDLRALDILKKKQIKEEEISSFEKIKELSGKLDILDEKKKHAINLREELIKRNERKN